MKGFSVYLIFKESITNILKHAKAERVFVGISETGGILELSIQDDGIGYTVGKTVSVGHYGTTNINTWAERIGGQLSLSSAPEKGTRILLSAPLTG